MNVTNTRTWLATTDRGAAALTLPKELSAADLNDLDEWLTLIMRSLRRPHDHQPQELEVMEPETP